MSIRELQSIAKCLGMYAEIEGDGMKAILFKKDDSLAGFVNLVTGNYTLL